MTKQRRAELQRKCYAGKALTPGEGKEVLLALTDKIIECERWKIEAKRLMGEKQNDTKRNS